MNAVRASLPYVLLSMWFACQPGPVVMALDPSAAEGEFPDTTLAGIYELALKEDLTIAQAQAELRIGGEERKLALAGLLPQINASYRKTDSDSLSSGSFAAGDFIVDNATDTSTDSKSWEIALQQPLLDFPAWFRFKQGSELSSQAKVTFAVAQQELLLRTVRAYFDVLRATANLRASKAQEASLRAQQEQVQQRFDVGLVAITDLLDANAGHDLAVAQRIANEGRLDISREILSVLTGRPHRGLWTLKENFPVREPDPGLAEDWVNFALASSMDIKVAQHGRSAAKNAMWAARSQHLPRIYLSLGRSDSSSDSFQRNLITGGDTTYPSDLVRDTIAINLSVPLFTGGATSALRRQAAARHERQTAFYDGTIRQVTQTIRTLFTQVSSDVSQSRALAKTVKSTESALESAKVGYRVGTRNAVDVLYAQQQYFSAIRDYDNSILDYVVNAVQLKRWSGNLSPQDIYELNNWLEPPAERL